MLQLSVSKSLISHKRIWERLTESGSRFPHSLLLVGPKGVGKGLFAAELAKGLLCEAGGTSISACGNCDSCRWFAAQSHPDFRRISPEADQEADADDTTSADRKKGSQQIKIAQIRELEDFVFFGSHRGKGRVIIIEPAEAMNTAAANSLLKLLEEPPVNVYFILISSGWRRLLPTIRSRCRIATFNRPSREEGAAWLTANKHEDAVEFLSFAGGAPMLAISEAERGGKTRRLLDSLVTPGSDPLMLASQWEAQISGDQGTTLEDIVSTLQKWLSDLALAKLGHSMRFIAGRTSEANQLIDRASAVGLIRCYNELSRVRALATHPLNPRLFLEELAERYLRALATARP